MFLSFVWCKNKVTKNNRFEFPETAFLVENLNFPAFQGE